MYESSLVLEKYTFNNLKLMGHHICVLFLNDTENIEKARQTERENDKANVVKC